MPHRKRYTAKEEYNAYYREYRAKNIEERRDYNRLYMRKWRKNHAKKRANVFHKIIHRIIHLTGFMKRV